MVEDHSDWHDVMMKKLARAPIFGLKVGSPTQRGEWKGGNRSSPNGTELMALQADDLAPQSCFVGLQEGIDMVYQIMGHWFNAASNTLAFSRCSTAKAAQNWGGREC